MRQRMGSISDVITKIIIFIFGALASGAIALAIMGSASKSGLGGVLTSFAAVAWFALLGLASRSIAAIFRRLRGTAPALLVVHLLTGLLSLGLFVPFAISFHGKPLSELLAWPELKPVALAVVVAPHLIWLTWDMLRRLFSKPT